MIAPKDLAAVLAGGVGAFNHSVWETRPTLSGKGPLDQMLTLHEWSHHELNNVSTVGLMLTFVAELARHARGDRERYGRLLNGLVDRSRVAHEVYATWYSVEQLSVAHPRADLLSRLLPEYLAYHALGERLVGTLASPFLRQQAFLTAVRSCFEALPFAALQPSAVDGFRLGDVRGRDFPDGRLTFLLANLPPDLFPNSAAEFCRSHPDREAVRLVEGALSRGNGQPFFDGYSPDADRATLDLLRWLSADLGRFLEGQQRPVGPFGGHLALVHRWVGVLDERCDPASARHRLVAAEAPDDTVAMIFRQMESEVYRVREHPMPVTSMPIAELPLDLWPNLPVREPPHLLVQIRPAGSVRQQHGDLGGAPELADLGDADPLAFLRRRGRDGNADLFYFRSPSELAVLREKTRAVPAYGIVSSVLCGDEKWMSDWLDDSVTWLTLIDHSLHAFLTTTCAAATQVIYEVSTLRDGDRSLTFLSFLTTSAEPGGSLYLSVCGELAAKGCLQFIEHGLRDPRFVRDGHIFTTDLSTILATVVTHLWQEETFFNSNQLTYSRGPA